jgi:hypothetical protein
MGRFTLVLGSTALHKGTRARAIKTVLHPFPTFDACHLRASKKMSLVNFVVAPFNFLMTTGRRVPSTVQSIPIWITPTTRQLSISNDNRISFGSSF